MPFASMKYSFSSSFRLDLTSMWIFLSAATLFSSVSKINGDDGDGAERQQMVGMSRPVLSFCHSMTPHCIDRPCIECYVTPCIVIAAILCHTAPAHPCPVSCSVLCSGPGPTALNCTIRYLEIYLQISISPFSQDLAVGLPIMSLLSGREKRTYRIEVLMLSVR